jgi:hypothetical protein
MKKSDYVSLVKDIHDLIEKGKYSHIKRRIDSKWQEIQLDFQQLKERKSKMTLIKYL